MKKVNIKSLRLVNFKGIRNKQITFTNNTEIRGANGSGKTTIFDSFCWLLFGKDSQGRADFQIKTLDENNNVIEKIDHEVEGIIEVDGVEKSLRKVLREKWVKKRGSLESEFTGNETEYYIDGVPMKQKEYQQAISEIIDEQIFKMITNPLAFNALKWEERRRILSAMTVTSDEEIAGEKYRSVLTEIQKYKSAEDYKKAIRASVLKAKQDIELIPARIDEVQRSKPEMKNWAEIESNIDAKRIELSEIDKAILDKTEAVKSVLDAKNANLVQQNELKQILIKYDNENKTKASESLAEDRKKLNGINNLISDRESELNHVISGLKTVDERIEGHQKSIDATNIGIEKYRKEWGETNAKVFHLDENQLCCPTCKRKEDNAEEKAQEYKFNFQENKKKELSELVEKANALKELVKKEQESIDALVARKQNGVEKKATLEKEIAELKSHLFVIDEGKEELIYQTLVAADTRIVEVMAQIQELQSKTFDTNIDDSELKEKRSAIQTQINALSAELNDKNAIDKADERVKQLLAEEKQLAQVIAAADRKLFDIEGFVKAKIEAIESQINGKFSTVRFKLFEKQINGGEVECCECLINGVPFSDANTASKINAGIDIINTLCDYYGVSAPIFVDNKESVSNLIESKSQIISLIVDSEKKEI